MPVVEVAVGLPVRGTFHYEVPPHLNASVEVGTRVLVPFGRRGITGVVVRHAQDSSPLAVTIKPIREVLRLSLPPLLIDMCLWIADYYEAPPGEVLRAALPSGTTITLQHDWQLTELGYAALRGERDIPLSVREKRALAKLVAGKPMRLPEAEQNVLRDHGLISPRETRKPPRVKTRMVAVVQLFREPSADEQKALARAPRRQAVLAQLRSSGGTMTVPDLRRQVKQASSTIQWLCQAGLVTVTHRVDERDPFRDPHLLTMVQHAVPLVLNAEQQHVVTALEQALAIKQFHPCLLHGVTGSGKTEVYLQVIAKALTEGRNAIVLVPEIALTPQLAARFRARFGDQVAILHSGLSNGERLDEWCRLREGRARIAVGARSAVFAPLTRVGVIVVDEEHDPSFKQEEGVHYHGRDVALWRAKKEDALCVLGSATPSLESYYQAQCGRYVLFELPHRATPRSLPTVDIVDMRKFIPDGETFLTAPLKEAIDAALAAGDQAILFLNRRGFATFVICVGCGRSFSCPECSVSLTYHRHVEQLCCHYCGHREDVPTACPQCGKARTIRRLGLGTERIEHALKERYPHARIGRLDRDTATGSGLREILRKMNQRELDLLIGTQMVTKGHDFPGVTLVGVLCADAGMMFPDFRATERTFQLLMQVAGRAGRGDRVGRVIIQTYSPGHSALACVQAHDYRRFYEAEISARAELGYPPHGRCIAIRFDGKAEAHVRQVAEVLAHRAEVLRKQASLRDVVVLGPEEAPLRKLKGRVRWHLWVRGPNRTALRTLVRQLTTSTDRLPRDVKVNIDVDPLATL